jgi:alcohol dehydrogenase class IV
VTAEPASFTFALPTRIRFGAGSRRAVGDIARGYGPRVALVSGERAAAGPAVADIVAAVEAAGAAVEMRHVARGEPDGAGVESLVEALRAAAVDAVIAVGGGSVLDVAKAASLLPTTERLGALLAGERAEQPGVPVIALPTTAGTGAEVSHGAIVLDRASGRKRGIRGPGVAPRDAIVDPELVLGAPAGVVATAGFDAVAHAVETSASRAASTLTLQLAADALPRLLDAVPRLQADPSSIAAASAAAYGAVLMGINLANSTTALPHRLQYPVGAMTGTSHGAGVAALFPAWLRRTVRHAPGSLAVLARASGVSPAGSSDDDAAAALEREILELLARLGLPTSLGTLGIRRGDVPELLARVEGSLANDPGPTAPEDLRDLYLSSL